MNEGEEGERENECERGAGIVSEWETETTSVRDNVSCSGERHRVTERERTSV